jgi:5,6-dimethylbenzimidazole synthase
MGAGVVTAMPSDPSQFSEAERRGVYRAIHERRDIRSQFLPTPIPDAILGRLLDAAHHGPSVGFMQPWDFIVIRDETVRRTVHDCFLEANRQAAEQYGGERRALYNSMKLAGILDAPVNLCVTCDRQRSRGAGLGRQSDPATDLYSTVCAVQNLWLAARAEELGVGWVSILDFDRLRALLEIPAELVPVAYLCIGYVSEFPARPELESNGWESRESLTRLIHFDRWSGQDERRASELVCPAVKTGAK